MDCILKIKLISDTCICSGASAGASVDTDVYTNEYGFPYIPSKRLKGLFRDAFLEYDEATKISPVKLPKFKENQINELLGESNKSIGGRLQISNADLDVFFNEKENIIKDIETNHIHPTTIKHMYVSTRTQTSIDEETGSSKSGSLRTINVVNKGSVFKSLITGLNEDEYNVVNNAIKLIKHMGINRNRGLGVVKLTIEKVTEEPRTIQPLKNFKYLELHITNEEALMISSYLKDKTLPYISGSAIYGYFANAYAKAKGIKLKDTNEHFNELFLEDNILFTNGYISDSEFNEYVPVPAFIKKQKNKAKDGSTIYINTFYEDKLPIEEKEKRKLSSLSGKYIRKDDLMNTNGLPLKALHIIEPEFEYNYHNALENGIVKENGFYSYFSIAPNQHFVSKIYFKEGKEKLVKELFSVVNSKTAYFGKCKNSQYGKCHIEVIEKNNIPTQKGNVLIFTSPCVFYDESNKPVLDIKKLTTKEYLDITLDDTPNYQLGYESFGGYNLLWNLPKKQLTTIQQESYIKGKMNITTNLVGADNHIGFGEIIILDEDTICKENNTTKENKVNNNYRLLSNWAKAGDYKIMMRKEEIMNEAYDFFIDKLENNPSDIKFDSSQTEKLLMMLKQTNYYSDFENCIENIKTESFKKKMKNLLKDAELNSASYYIFLKTLLTLIKYNIRKGDK